MSRRLTIGWPWSVPENVTGVPGWRLSTAMEKSGAPVGPDCSMGVRLLSRLIATYAMPVVASARASGAIVISMRGPVGGCRASLSSRVASVAAITAARAAVTRRVTVMASFYHS
jgi:hypothetical protein